MSGPEERIFAWWEYDNDHRPLNRWSEDADADRRDRFDHAEYIRADLHAAAIARLEKDVQAYSKANHAQALCIHFAASALGVNYAATIKGLPKGCRAIRERAERAEAALAVAEEGLRFADETFRDLGWHAKWQVTTTALAEIAALKGGAE